MVQKLCKYASFRAIVKAIIESGNINLNKALECKWVCIAGTPPTTIFKQLIEEMPSKKIYSIAFSMG